jgi:hypothetical protein
MRTLLVLVFLMSDVGHTLRLGPPHALQGAPQSQAGRLSVTGTGRHFGADPPSPAIQVHINATTDGDNLRGQLISDMTNETVVGRYVGRITCLNVWEEGADTHATIGILVVKSDNPGYVGMGQLWSVVDGGPGGEDRIAGYPLTYTAPSECPPVFFDVPVTEGNYVIDDGSR